MKNTINFITVLSILFLIPTNSSSGQEINIGFQDSIESEVLNENRKLLINLPKDYCNSDKSYPVLYLYGELDLFIEMVCVNNRLAFTEELIPEMIVDMIENTNRSRDMMPANTSFYQSEPDGVIEKQLSNFSQLMESDRINVGEYKIYKDEGHFPFQSLYHGLRFLYE